MPGAQRNTSNNGNRNQNKKGSSSIVQADKTSQELMLFIRLSDIHSPKETMMPCCPKSTIRDVAEHFCHDQKLSITSDELVLVSYIINNKKCTISSRDSSRTISDLGIKNKSTLYFVIKHPTQSEASIDTDNGREVALFWSLGDRELTYNCTAKTTVGDLISEIQSTAGMKATPSQMELFIAHQRLDITYLNKKLFDCGVDKDCHIFLNIAKQPQSITTVDSSTTLFVNVPVEDGAWDVILQGTLPLKTTIAALKQMVADFEPLKRKIQRDQILLYFEDSHLNGRYRDEDTLASLGIGSICKLRVDKLNSPLPTESSNLATTNVMTTETANENQTKSTETLGVSAISIENSSTSVKCSLATLTKTKKTSLLRRSNIIGLENLENTCYMNSALQCLIHVPQLSLFFLEAIEASPLARQDFRENPFDTYGEITSAYAEFIWQVWNNTSKVIKPCRIRKAVARLAPHFNTSDEQDIKEFMTHLIKGMDNELQDKTQSDTATILQSLFYVNLQSRITSDACHHEVTTSNMIIFLPAYVIERTRTFDVKYVTKSWPLNSPEIISIKVNANGRVKDVMEAVVEKKRLWYQRLSIYASNNPQQLYDMEKPLNTIIDKEITVEDKGYDSSYSPHFANSSVDSTRNLIDCLRELTQPEVLKDGWHCEICKELTRAIKRVQFVVLPPVLIIEVKRYAMDKYGEKRKLNTMVHYPVKGLDLSEFVRSNNNDEQFIYDLVAVCNHVGTLNSGHYTAFARQDLNESWYKFNDHLVERVFTNQYVVTDNAYLLIYVKRGQE